MPESPTDEPGATTHPNQSSEGETGETGETLGTGGTLQPAQTHEPAETPEPAEAFEPSETANTAEATQLGAPTETATMGQLGESAQPSEVAEQGEGDESGAVPEALSGVGAQQGLLRIGGYREGGAAGAAGAGYGAPEGADATALSRPEMRRMEQQSRRKRRRKRWIFWSAIGVVSVIVLAAAAEGAFLFYESHRVHHTTVNGLKKVPSSGVENILMIGSTTRCGLNGQQSQAFGTCEEAPGVNSDVVMILHLNPVDHKAAILSIPRDTFVPNARLDGSNKIDAALGDPEDPNLDPIVGDPSQLVRAVTEDFGIPINHFVELNFDTFQGVVSALGGLKMYFPMAVYDQQSDLDQTPGCNELTPFQALALVRARHLYYQPASAADEPPPSTPGSPPPPGWVADPQSDLSRIRRDHEFLRVLAAAVAKRGLGNPITDDELIDAVAGDLTLDQGFSTSDLAQLALTWHSTSPQSVPTYTLPVSTYGNSNGYVYGQDGSNYGDVVFPVQPEDAQVVSQFLGRAPNQTPDGTTMPAPSSITVAVENGTGVYNQGATTAQQLAALGFQIGQVTDTASQASVNEAVVLYGNPSMLSDALEVQSQLQGLAIIAYDPGIVAGAQSVGAVGQDSSTVTVGEMSSKLIDVGTPINTAADVVLVTGSNFSVNPPSQPSTGTSASPTTTAPHSGSSSSGSSSQTTQPVTPAQLASNPDLSAPSQAITPLQPWDPRSCSASGGPGT